MIKLLKRNIHNIANVILFASITYIVVYIAVIFALNEYTAILHDMGYIKFETIKEIK